MMSDPKPVREQRRPEHIPQDWLTRQKAQAELRLRSPYGLVKLLAQLQPTDQDFQVVGQAGYLSPRLIERMRLELATVEDIRDLPGYLSGMAAQAAIGCNFTKFSELVLAYPPSVQTREVVKARNNNSEVNPVYSPTYVDSLKRFYEPVQRKTTGSQSSSTPGLEGDRNPRPSHALVDKVLERIDRTPEAKLVDPNYVGYRYLLGV